MALYGIYGKHAPEVCPIYVRDNARVFMAIAELEAGELAERWGIRKFLGRYHSALEHTFLWIVEADGPHAIERFGVETELARFNELTIVPLNTFSATVEGLRESHGG